jgi:copper transporter 1
MDMPTSSDSSSSTMQMSMWMTTRYSNTPAFFKSLHANTGAGAFGVFCVLFFCSFFFRGLIFLSAYLEQVIFHNYSNTIIIEEDCECGIEDSKSSPQPPKVDLSVGQIFKKLLWMGPREFINDIVRLLVAFLIAMFGYAIMLAAMSFVVLYFFAICLGLAFAEVFFNKLSIILNINKSFGLH